MADEIERGNAADGSREVGLHTEPVGFEIMSVFCWKPKHDCKTCCGLTGRVAVKEE